MTRTKPGYRGIVNYYTNPDNVRKITDNRYFIDTFFLLLTYLSNIQGLLWLNVQMSHIVNYVTECKVISEY